MPITQSPFPALMSPQGYLFVVTYAYSGSTDIIRSINAHGIFDIKGNLGPLIMGLAATHTALKPIQATDKNQDLGSNTDFASEALRHDILGWTFADSFARHVLGINGPTPSIQGATLSYAGSDRKELLSTMSFLHAFFPNARFVCVTRNAEDIVSRPRKNDVSDEAMTRRLQYLDRSFMMFRDRHPHLCLILKFNQFKSNPETASILHQFLDEATSGTVSSSSIMEVSDEKT